MKKAILSISLLLVFGLSFGQTNFFLTSNEAEQIIKGNFNPDDYQAATVLNHPEDIVAGVTQNVDAENLKQLLIEMSVFENRNTGSDTTSATNGIGASRRWVHEKFEEYQVQSAGRLIPFYFQFDEEICEVGQHRNVCAVLPGLDVSNHSVILIEAHMDSRCAGACDIDCPAHGMEDNGSGTALVMELARVMSQYSFSSTIVFMATIGEEQGLFGANAFAAWVEANNIPMKAVFNNDIVGGIICGETSSAPSCPGLNDVDSTQVRIFSGGSSNSPHKSLARFIKLEYAEEVEENASVPMLITLMSALDRTGRGGDHIPFTQRGYAAVRFTSANEHGNANAADPDYHDRQHTSDDILGVDTDGDMVLDSFFVDFNYLARNAVINGVASGMAAIGPETPSFSAENNAGEITVTIDDPNDYGKYRIGIRHTGIDFDELIDVEDGNVGVYYPYEPGPYFISVCSVDSNGIESLFGNEELFIASTIVGVEEVDISEEESKAIELFQNRPNPFDEATYISFMVHEMIPHQKAAIVIRDLNGKEIRSIATNVRMGLNEILYDHGYNTIGTFVYSLELDGKVIDSRQMIFAN